MTTFKINFRQRVEKIVSDLLSRNASQFSNSSAFPDGKVNAVANDGKHADLFINAATTATASVPVAPHIVGTLVVGDEVIILRRSPRDMMVLSKKQK